MGGARVSFAAGVIHNEDVTSEGSVRTMSTGQAGSQR